MVEINELYQELVLAHGNSPSNFHEMSDATRTAEGFNPFCGDQLTLYLKIENGQVMEATFTGRGCAISKASASLMTEAVKSRTIVEARQTFTAFHKMITRGPEEYEASGLGDLEALAGVRQFPTRIKCAILSWHTLESALKDENETVSTE